VAFGSPAGYAGRSAACATPRLRHFVMAACKLRDVEGDSNGHLVVFEIGVRGSGRTISIQVGRLPLESASRRADPGSCFVGGPGQSAIGSAADYARLLAPLRRHRDLSSSTSGTGGSIPPVRRVWATAWPGNSAISCLQPSSAAAAMH